MTTDLERLTVQLEATTNKFTREINKAHREANRRFREMERSATDMENSVSGSLSRMGRATSTAIAAIGVSLSVGQLRTYADTWQDMANKIAAAGEKTERVAAVQDKIASVAIASRADLKATSDLYVGLTRSTEQLGASQAQVMRVVETVNKAFAVGGASAAEQAGGILQLNQALSSGVLQGDELRSIRENAPLVAKAIADEFGVAIGGLKELGAEGELTGDRVFQALLKASASIDDQFSKTSATVSQSFTNLSTALTRYFGQLDRATGASQAFAQGIQVIANNIDAVMRGAAVIGVALAAAFAPAIVAGAAALAAPLIGVAGIATGVVAAAAAMAVFGDNVKPIAGDIATVVDYAAVGFQMVAQQGGAAASYLYEQFAKASDLIVAALSATGDNATFEKIAEAAKTAVNLVIGTFTFAVAQIQTVWNGLGPAMVASIVGAMNAVIATVEAAMQRIATSVNNVITMLGGAARAVPTFGRIDNSYAEAGTAAAKQFGDNFKLLTRDYIGEAGAELAKGLEEVRKKANERAATRAAAGAKPLDMGDINAKLTPPVGTGDKGGGGKKGKGGGPDEFQREIENIEKRTLAFGREQAALRLSAYEAAKAEASFKLLDAAKAAGIPVTDAMRARVEALSDAYAKAKTSLDAAKEQQEAFNDLQKFMGNSISGFLSDVVSGGKNAEKAMMNLTKKIADAALQAALLGEGPFGKILGLGGKDGGTGGLIGMLFKGVTGKEGFAAGGFTGAGGKRQPKGIVHAGEYVMDAETVRRAGGPGAFDAMRRNLKGYAAGGYVGPPSPSSLRRTTGGTNVVINNNTGQPVSQTTAPNGDTQIDIGKMIDGAMAEQMGGSARGATSKILQARMNRANLRG